LKGINLTNHLSRLLVQENISDFTPFLSLRHVVSAGEPLNPEVIHSWHQATGLIIREGYGQTETVALTGNFKCIPNKPGSMGKPSPGMDVRVIDESGEVCPHGVEGDIALKVAPERPMGLFNGYVDEPTRTASAFRGNFYLTGDRGHVDEDGYIWFVGRSDDVIISSGYRIGPFEVESALLEHPDVVEAAVVSSPDVIRGEVVKAFVVLTSGCQKKIEASVEPEEDKKKLIKQLQDFVKNSTAPYKYPRKVEIVTALPKTISGKIRRVELRQKEWGRGMAVNN
jgi:medium-chain acyl-CoA synthetase